MRKFTTEARQGNEGLGFLDGINRIGRILRIIPDEETQTKRDAGGRWSEAHQGWLNTEHKVNSTKADLSRASVVGIAEYRAGRTGVKSLQSYHKDIH